MLGDNQSLSYPLALNSLPFLAFLALSVLAYFVLPLKWRTVTVVLLSSLFYLSWVSPLALLGLFGLVLTAHLVGRAMERLPDWRLPLCYAGVIVAIGTLALLKYFDFFVAESMRLLQWLGLAAEGASAPGLGWLLPVGYSFITFTVTSYIVDVYRGKQRPAPFTDLAAFVSFFPKLLAGPIERGTHFLPQWFEKRRFDSTRAVLGIQLIIWGLFKKVVIADRLAPFVNAAYETPAFSTPVELVVGTYFYAFQIYCDFSGYSDIAIGSILLFGLALAPNFRHPYLSRSVPEFWSQRWHISLATWFRDYLYIPLGGSRAGAIRTYLNVMVVFVVSGIWHAGMVGSETSWGFAVWGALNGLYVVVWTLLARLWGGVAGLAPRLGAVGRNPIVALLQGLVTFHLITFSWIFFRAGNLADGWTVVTRIIDNLASLPMLLGFYDYRNFDFVASLVLIVVLLGIELASERRPLVERVASAPVAWRWGYSYLMLAALVVMGEWGTPVFIYMQF